MFVKNERVLISRRVVEMTDYCFEDMVIIIDKVKEEAQFCAFACQMLLKYECSTGDL